MASQYLHSGEPLPLAPSLTGDVDQDIVELLNFHTKLLDYLRRLTAKLSNDTFSPPQSTAIESMVLTLSGDYNVTGDPETIIWNQVQRLDAPFSYNTVTGVITFNVDGFYILFTNIYAIGEIAYGTRWVDGSATRLPYGDGTVNVIGVESQLCQAVPVHIHATQTLAFQILGIVASNDLEAANSSLCIVKLGGFSGTGSDSPDPCDFDIWQLCP